MTNGIDVILPIGKPGAPAVVVLNIDSHAKDLHHTGIM